MTIARVTNQSMSMAALANLQGDLAGLAKTQSQLATGKVINRPSDDPAGTAIAMDARAAMARNTQYGRNAQDGLSWLGTADSALTSITANIASIRTLMVQAQSGAASSDSDSAIGSEISQLRDEMLNTANASYNNIPVFAGTAAVTGAYTASGVYKGNSGVVSRQVSDNVKVPVAVAGSSVFGTPGSDVFSLLTQIASDVKNNPSAIDGDLTKLDGFTQGIAAAHSTIGANYNRVQAAQTAASDAVTTLDQTRSTVEDADLAKTTITLQMQQVSYQAALAATAKAITPSLLDFLK